jgi:hypothetical protein
MRVCDRCLKKIDNDYHVRLAVEAYGLVGQHVKSGSAELCRACYQRIEDYINNKQNEELKEKTND